ncbi:LOW QUALITY PROTEIN: hypothetical protein NC651_031507 [Populus alba x Populus x berolinensis]|nr:LOW QUALITY PROTEIN: hypothetical protein NC651_031507 [Populus alba x Populus x berolinensis]
MENPNPILQNQEREICLKAQTQWIPHPIHTGPPHPPLFSPSAATEKKKRGKASTSTTLAPQYFPAAHPYKVAKEKQKQTLLPATINQSFSCSRATLSEHSRERASKILRDLGRECLMQSDLEVYQQKDQSM